MAAESFLLAGRANLKAAKAQTKRGEQLHQRRGTKSLVSLVQPEPTWSRTLEAISRLGVPPTMAGKRSASNEPTDRLIWEIHHSEVDFYLDVYQQVRKGNKWSKGRKVALSRLHDEYNEPSFSFITTQDKLLCQALRKWSERGSYGYPEEYCEFQTRPAVRAIIGHPNVYWPGNRDSPVEMVEQPPTLVVRNIDSRQIEISMRPAPSRSSDLRISKLNDDQVAFTLFEPSTLSCSRCWAKNWKSPRQPHRRFCKPLPKSLRWSPFIRSSVTLY